MFQFTSTARLLARDLTRLAVSTRDGTRELLEQAVDEVVRPSIAANFEAGGRPPWDELADSTTQRRERQGLGTRPLLATGQGRDAAVSRDRWLVTRDAASYPGAGWTGPDAYIRHHQLGTEDDHFPARPFLALQPEDERALDRTGLAWVDGNLRRAGF